MVANHEGNQHEQKRLNVHNDDQGMGENMIAIAVFWGLWRTVPGGFNQLRVGLNQVDSEEKAERLAREKTELDDAHKDCER
jgi:hypothetical protein